MLYDGAIKFCNIAIAGIDPAAYSPQYADPGNGGKE